MTDPSSANQLWDANGNLINKEKPVILLACPDLRPYTHIIPTLKYSYDVEIIDQGYAAVDFIMNSNNVKAAIISTELPGLSGFQVAKRASDHRSMTDGKSHVPVMLVGDKNKDVDAIDRLKEYSDALAFIPFSDGEFLSKFWVLCDRVSERKWDKLNYSQSSVLKVTKRSLEKIFDFNVKEKSCHIELIKECSDAVVDAAQSDDLDGVLKMLREHHSYTFVHNLTVSSLMTIFGTQLGLKRHDLHTLAQGGLLHDIGKSMTPPELLDKPGPLSDEEWVVMKQHVIHSGEIMRADKGIPKEIINLAERHPKKVDGSGYPYGLKGSELDDLSLITAITDVYSALTDKRSYKPALKKDKVIEILTSMRGHHLESGFLDKFLEMLQDDVFH